ncbi:hypothetical protein JT359_19320 [Candidatus Poribacteria bacterium]|nr:hypothetical protein [Candidatus Poribacteria bacterium]
MDVKRRRSFQLEDVEGNKLASGILYDEGNVQVLWRIDIGYTAEQYSSLHLIIDLIPGIVVLRMPGSEERNLEDVLS